MNLTTSIGHEGHHQTDGSGENFKDRRIHSLFESPVKNLNQSFQNEINRRRTLAIISHPDAGKTTLTEKILLYGGALELAGSVKAKKNQRDTASDWMELEKKRGISISSTVLQFEYQNYRFNLLDTPGHKDFSEDTYRVLTAVDGVIMVIDAAKGIESQTIKLFEICRKHGIAIFTFINKMDRPSMTPFELIDQLEDLLKIEAYPINWPIGNGPSFKGLYDRLKKQVHLFDRSVGGVHKAPYSIHSITDQSFKELLMGDAYVNFVEENDLLDSIHEEFDEKRILNGSLSPLYFGSAVNNFGVELLLKGFLEFSSPPLPRLTAGGHLLKLDNPLFSAFVFKIQTNMNPMHRDRMVFARVCSGNFRRDSKVFNTRNGKEIRLSSTHSMFGQERETVNEAFPGDIIGFITNHDFKIGDTISSDPKTVFAQIPRFAPELFAYITNANASQHKPFRKGLDHLIGEDIVQVFQLHDRPRNVPLLGATGILQFEVLQYRLRDEYRVENRLEMMPWKILRWLRDPMAEDELRNRLSYTGVMGVDIYNNQVLLFENSWTFRSFVDKNPTIALLDEFSQLGLPQQT